MFNTILELNISGQSGLTLRTMEALFYHKKLITNNENVKNFHLSITLISGIMNAKSFIEYVLRFDSPGGYLWNKLFRRKIIFDNSLRFDTEFSIAEYLLFCIEYVLL